MDVSTYQRSDAKINILGVSSEFSSSKDWLSIKFLIEEIKPLVSEKFDFEYRDISKNMALIQNF